MDSTDEKIHHKQQMIKEADMVEHGKKQQREIAKKRLDPNYKRDKNEAISSTDYETKPAASINEVGGNDSNASPSKDEPLTNKFKKEKPKNSF
mmetsp:Transcript_28628/g.43238  ORF Transcript_28628/g.43238 Transcript_28628/m.43238 type:complete len:93 (+) Transcript_28628:430-708(+)